jgi:ABC-type transport system involved in multi-copper enzyme maturation permease subunit
MKNLMLLTKVDFVRIWSLGKIITAISLGVVACILSALPALMGWITENERLYMPFSDYIIQIWKVIVPFAALFFTSGIISNDIKNHWLRSLLVHGVTRQDVIISKILSSLISVFIMMIILGVFPLITFSLSLGLGLNIKFVNLLLVTISWLLEAGMFIAMATWLSCFMQGFMNIFLLAGWMFLDNVIMKGLLSLWLNNTFSGTLIVDFFFPSGFSEAANIASSSGTFPFEYIFWGLSALSFFISLSLYHFNKLTLDVNSD